MAKKLRQTPVKNHNPAKDKIFKALKPGKRVSKTGNIYYEYRINRSDINPRKRY